VVGSWRDVSKTILGILSYRRCVLGVSTESLSSCGALLVVEEKIKTMVSKSLAAAALLVAVAVAVPGGSAKSVEVDIVKRYEPRKECSRHTVTD
jgi:hypothetical protein